MSESRDRPGDPPRRSASAEAFALRWADEHPEDDVDHPPPGAPEPEDGVPNRHSASAEAAALKLRERESEREADGGAAEDR